MPEHCPKCHSREDQTIQLPTTSTFALELCPGVECGHESELARIMGAERAEQSRLINERDEAKAELARLRARDEVAKEMYEELREGKRKLDCHKMPSTVIGDLIRRFEEAGKK